MSLTEELSRAGAGTAIISFIAHRALVDNPLNYVEQTNASSVPLDSRAISYIRQKAIPSNPATLVADFEKSNPFHIQLRVNGQSGWLVAPDSTPGRYGLSVFYIGPINEGSSRMTGVILQFATRKRSPYDLQLLSRQLLDTLTGMGFEDIDSVMSNAVNLTPTSKGGEFRGVGNFIVARHYELERENVFNWYSVAIFRRVALPPELRPELN